MFASMEEQVILVDEKDNPIGLMGKMEAHEKAILHRAFSVFIFNEKGELLLQQRAASKYHSPYYGQILVVPIKEMVRRILEPVEGDCKKRWVLILK